MSIAKATLIGRLGIDPESKETTTGKKFCSFRMATSKKIKGEEITQWHSVTVWSENDAAYLLNYAQKGTLLYVEGEIEYRTYQKNGVDMWATDISVNPYNGTVQILKDGVPREDNRAPVTRKKYGDSKPASKPKPEYNEEQRARDRAEFDDDIPF